MNSHYFGHLRGFALFSLLVATAISCTKSDRTATPDAIMGSWKVTDVTIVNEEAGIHCTQKDLSGIGNSGIEFAADGSYSINGSQNGTWMHQRGVLQVRSSGGEMIQFKVNQSDDGAIHLERYLQQANGLSAAVVNYTLEKQ